MIQRLRECDRGHHTGGWNTAGEGVCHDVLLPDMANVSGELGDVSWLFGDEGGEILVRLHLSVDQ